MIWGGASLYLMPGVHLLLDSEAQRHSQRCQVGLSPRYDWTQASSLPCFSEPLTVLLTPTSATGSPGLLCDSSHGLLPLLSCFVLGICFLFLKISVLFLLELSIQSWEGEIQDFFFFHF